MLVVCDLCGKQLNIPDKKVPDRPFGMVCPVCKGRIQVDPTAQTRNHVESAPGAAPAPAAAVSSPPEDPADHELRPLPAADQHLLATLSMSAVIVDFAQPPVPAIAAALRKLGFNEIRHFSDLDEACEAIEENEIGLLMLCFEKAAPPPCEPLQSLYKLPLEVRRRTFTALTAENVRSLDGQAAFYLQVNCVLSSQEIEALPSKLRRALVFHRRNYRFWNAQE